MKQYKTTLIALALILVVLGGYFAIRHFDVRDKKDPARTEAPDPIRTTDGIFPFGKDAEAASKIVKIECNAWDRIVLEQSNGAWRCTSYPDLDVLDKNVSSIIRTMQSCGGALIYEGPVTEEKQAEFGLLDSEKRITVTMRDGTEYCVIFGGFTTDGYYCYMWLEGDSAIYRCDPGFRDNLMLNKADLITKDLFNFSDPGQITRITVLRGGERAMQLSATLSGVVGADRTWQMNYPLNRAGNAAHIENFLSTLLSLRISDIAVSVCEDPAAYGFSPADYTVSVSAPDKTVTIRLGNKTKDGTAYYLMTEGCNDIYTISASSITFKDESSLLYADRYVYMVMYTKLSEVRLKLFDQTYVLKYEFPDGGERFSFNGICVTEPDRDFRLEFTRIGTAMYGLEIRELEAEPETKGEVLCEILYRQSDGTETTVTCTRRDENTMYYYINGEYAGGYGNLYLLTSDNEHYGIQGTVDNLRSLLGMA